MWNISTEQNATLSIVGSRGLQNDQFQKWSNEFQKHYLAGAETKQTDL
jgi:hypothetical protein